MMMIGARYGLVDVERRRTTVVFCVCEKIAARDDGGPARISWGGGLCARGRANFLGWKVRVCMVHTKNDARSQN